MKYFCACRYLYCDEISLEADNVLATLYAAKKYIIPHLARACVEYLETNLDSSNACMLLNHSLLFDEPELMQRCWNVIDIQTEEVLQSDSFIDIDHKTLEAILSRDSLDANEADLFVAATRWAEAECTRQGRDTSPHECREVLGEALYLLRFPTMTPRDFADGAGKSGILDMQEINDLLFHLTATDKPKLMFPTTCRKKRPMRRCLRFATYSCGSLIGWEYEGKCYNIHFSVDNSIFVAGFGLYGSLDGSVEYQVTIQLKRGDCHLLSKDHSILCDGSSDRFNVFFDSPVQIEANTYYTASLYLQNPNNGHYGCKGMSDVSCHGINFTFKDTSDISNSTGVGSGQIPEILFYCWISPTTVISLLPLIPRFMGPTWGQLEPTGPKWAPCWPHELCYLGLLYDGQVNVISSVYNNHFLDVSKDQQYSI